jgi:soluble lytic murein transglycosylase-like protein
MKARDIIIASAVMTGVFLFIRKTQEPGEKAVLPEIVLPSEIPLSNPVQANVMRWHKILWLNGQNFGVEPAVLAAIMHRESEGNQDAIRYEAKKKDYSYGLMQVLSATARWLGFNADNDLLLEPEINIYYGAKYLKNRLNLYGNMIDAISAYNCGTVDKKSGNYSNQGYVYAVVANVSVYREHFRIFYPDYNREVVMAKDIFDPSYFW